MASMSPWRVPTFVLTSKPHRCGAPHLKQRSLLVFVSHCYFRVATTVKFHLRAETDVGIAIASEHLQYRNIPLIPTLAALGCQKALVATVPALGSIPPTARRWTRSACPADGVRSRTRRASRDGREGRSRAYIMITSHKGFTYPRKMVLYSLRGHKRGRSAVKALYAKPSLRYLRRTSNRLPSLSVFAL